MLQSFNLRFSVHLLVAWFIFPSYGWFILIILIFCNIFNFLELIWYIDLHILLGLIRKTWLVFFFFLGKIYYVIELLISITNADRINYLNIVISISGVNLGLILVRHFRFIILWCFILIYFNFSYLSIIFKEFQ